MIASSPVIYIFVLFGSFFGICAILGARVAIRHRGVRRFVRGIRHRTESAAKRGFGIAETPVEKPRSNPRTTALQLQQVRSLMREAEKFIARDKMKEAEESLIKAITVDPTSKEARAELARLFLKTSQAKKAYALYKELIEESENVSFYANLGLASYRIGNFEESCEAYRKAMELDPGNAERIAALGRAKIAALKYEEAIPLLEKASERLSRDEALLTILAECYAELGHCQQAHDTYLRLNKIKPYDELVKERLKELATT